VPSQANLEKHVTTWHVQNMLISISTLIQTFKPHCSYAKKRVHPAKRTRTATYHTTLSLLRAHTPHLPITLNITTSPPHRVPPPPTARPSPHQQQNFAPSHRAQIHLRASCDVVAYAVPQRQYCAKPARWPAGARVQGLAERSSLSGVGCRCAGPAHGVAWCGSLIRSLPG
jgi:hypothetical protein